jgi:hypothetical protein
MDNSGFSKQVSSGSGINSNAVYEKGMKDYFEGKLQIKPTTVIETDPEDAETAYNNAMKAYFEERNKKNASVKK